MALASTSRAGRSNALAARKNCRTTAASSLSRRQGVLSVACDRLSWLPHNLVSEIKFYFSRHLSRLSQHESPIFGLHHKRPRRHEAQNAKCPSFSVKGGSHEVTKSQRGAKHEAAPKEEHQRTIVHRSKTRQAGKKVNALRRPPEHSRPGTNTTSNHLISGAA